MYQNSSPKIKLLNKLSESIDVLVGTEQGHPMSPELFKLYLLELSDNLNDMDGLEVPTINGVKLSHLLWADDLVLVALTKKSLQSLIDKVHQYCLIWGLGVNLAKTAIMVFNTNGRQLKESFTFHYGEVDIPSTKTYCYLGIIFNLNGTFITATDELRKKGLRAYFSMKRLLNINVLSSKVYSNSLTH